MRPTHEQPTDEQPTDALEPPLLIDLDDVPGVTTHAPAAAAPAKTRTPHQALFEIGVVYRKGSRCFLAVSDRMLITIKGDEVQEIRPTSRYDVVRSISVQELCAMWGITLEHLDATVVRYLAPSQEAIKTRPRGSRRQRALDELRWRSQRLVRLLAG